jgi:hypothetical protein
MKEEKQDNFDYANFEKEAIEKLKNGTELGGKDGVLAPYYRFYFPNSHFL